jgi:hypothetical protein
LTRRIDDPADFDCSRGEKPPKFPPSEIDVDPDEVFRDVREKHPGRDFKL